MRDWLVTLVDQGKKLGHYEMLLTEKKNKEEDMDHADEDDKSKNEDDKLKGNF
jgi:hypothetical protein